MDPVIDVSHVGLHLPIIGADARLLRKMVFGRYVGSKVTQKSIVYVRALHDITMRINSGDRVGLIGHNGAGKSTLLRLLAGVYQPTGGSISVHGKVSALLSPGLGMDLEDSGYDNIRNIALMLGMSRSETEAKFQEIADFTELGGYLAMPVRTYSAGMQLRLTFAVITAIDPDILLLDEGLGAGDARFAKRAQQRVNSLIRRTNVMVLASHSESMIREMCNRAALLDQGQLVSFGSVDSVFQDYYRLDRELG